MRAFSLKYAEENLEKIARETIENDEETVITLDSGKAVILVSLAIWNAQQKTEYLLKNPANKKHLMKSIEQYRAGQVITRDLIE